MAALTNIDYCEANSTIILNHGVCSICGRRLEEGEPLTVGRTDSGRMEVACDKCKQQIKEVVRELTFHNRNYVVPAGGTKLWRYIDFTKFLSLLETESLFFTRADRFEDPFEGARGFQYQTKEAYETVEKFKLLELKSKYQKEGKPLPSNGELCRIVADEMVAVRENYKKLRETVFISCWHANERESEGMWKLYTSVMAQGVAIQTTVEHLCQSLSDPNYEIGHVRYIDYNEPLKINQRPYWYKRNAFRHEDEVRAVIIDNSLKAYGKQVHVNLDYLIDGVYISPTAQGWFADLVKSVCRRYGLHKPVIHSALNEIPLY